MPNTYTPFQPTLSKQSRQHLGLSLSITAPKPPLHSAVQAYLQISATRPTPYPVIPDGGQALFFSPQSVTFGGAYTHAYKVPILQPGDYFGIWFRPGGLRKLFKLDLSEITNCMVDEQFLSQLNLTTLRDDIYDCNSFEERAHLCNKALYKHLFGNSDRFDYTLSLVYNQYGNIRASAISKQSGWSERQLNRLFTRHTGLSTKAFTNIIRLQHAGRMIIAAPHDSLGIAHSLGYFDQSHLIKSFQQHLFTSPQGFAQRCMSDFYNP